MRGPAFGVVVSDCLSILFGTDVRVSVICAVVSLGFGVSAGFK